jgi:hypothetical protein
MRLPALPRSASLAEPARASNDEASSASSSSQTSHTALLLDPHVRKKVRGGELRERLACAHPPRHLYRAGPFMRRRREAHDSSADGGVLALTLAPVLFRPACMARGVSRTVRSHPVFNLLPASQLGKCDGGALSSALRVPRSPKDHQFEVLLHKRRPQWIPASEGGEACAHMHVGIPLALAMVLDADASP